MPTPPAPARHLARALILAAVAAGPGAADAQMWKAPTFVFEPGVLTVNAVSPALGQARGTGFNLRFLAIIPTRTPRVALLFGTRFAPYGVSGGGERDNDPAFFYGVILPLLYQESTYGWLEVTLPVFAQYQAGGGGGKNARNYGVDYYVEGAAVVHLGRKLLRDMGSFWPKISAYVRVDHNLTPNAYTIIGREGEEIQVKADRWNPSFQYGLSIPVFGR